MSGFIAITSRRLPRNVKNLCLLVRRNQEVKLAVPGRQSSIVAASQAQLFADQSTASACHQTQRVLSRRLIHTTTRLLQIETVNVPPFAESVSEGDVKFTTKVGDVVAMDQVVMEVETDKTSVPIPSPFSGVITEILVKDGDTVKPGQALFKIEKKEGLTPTATAGAAAPAPSPPKAAAAAPPPPAAAAPAARASPPPAAARPPPPPRPTSPPPAPAKPTAPAAKLPPPSTQSMQVPPQVRVPPTDYTREITGTRTEQRVKMNRMRLKIAQRLKDAQNETAMLTTFNEIDMR